MPNLPFEVFAHSKKPTPNDLDEVVKTIKTLRQVNTESQGYYDRLQRASSWLAKAKRTTTDSEGKFIFLWIALNALYGVREDFFNSPWWEKEIKSLQPLSKRDGGNKNPPELEWFLWRICGLDHGQRILKSVIRPHQDDIEMILRTEYLMPNYWSWNWRTEQDINEGKRLSRLSIAHATNSGGTRKSIYKALEEVLVWRLRILRNQLFHGCATDIYSKRREAGESELDAGSRLLEELIWVFLVVMAGETGRARYWPPCPYPRVGSAQHGSFDASWLPK